MLFRRVVLLWLGLLALVGVTGQVTAEPLTTLSAASLPVDSAVTASAILPFASLAAALSAQTAADAAEDETLRCMATTIWYESHGEPLDGQLAVAEVILNRTKSGRYPTDVCGVVKQRGQFSFVRDGVLPTIEAGRRGFSTALQVARVALAKAWESSAPKALFFHARHVGPSARMVRVAAIGNHVFYR
jgi:spore germination cell wall hydrolase CwlJ-like protein